jgi:hypothetical protein
LAHGLLKRVRSPPEQSFGGDMVRLSALLPAKFKGAVKDALAPGGRKVVKDHGGN